MFFCSDQLCNKLGGNKYSLLELLASLVQELAIIFQCLKMSLSLSFLVRSFLSISRVTSLLDFWLCIYQTSLNEWEGHHRAVWEKVYIFILHTSTSDNQGLPAPAFGNNVGQYQNYALPSAVPPLNTKMAPPSYDAVSDVVESGVHCSAILELVLEC